MIERVITDCDLHQSTTARELENLAISYAEKYRKFINGEKNIFDDHAKQKGENQEKEFKQAISNMTKEQLMELNNQISLVQNNEEIIDSNRSL